MALSREEAVLERLLTEHEERERAHELKNGFLDEVARRAAEKALVEEQERREIAETEAAAAARAAEMAAREEAVAAEFASKADEQLRRKRGGPDGKGGWSPEEVAYAIAGTSTL